MYKIKIAETWISNSKRFEFRFETELPFIPIIGMYWENEDLAINLPVENLTWSGDYNMFVIKRYVSKASEEELEHFYEEATKKGWKVTIK